MNEDKQQALINYLTKQSEDLAKLLDQVKPQPRNTSVVDVMMEQGVAEYNQARRLIAQGAVRVNDVVVKKDYILSEGTHYIRARGQVIKVIMGKEFYLSHYCEQVKPEKEVTIILSPEDQFAESVFKKYNLQELGRIEHRLNNSYLTINQWRKIKNVLHNASLNIQQIIDKGE